VPGGKLHYGIHGANVGQLASLEGAEAVGAAIRRHRLESVWAWEQIAIPANFASPWPYSPDGKLATPDNVALMDPMVWLASVGALAPDVRLATGVFLLALHDPVIVAKATATLDLLTRQRLILGVGAGWLKEEYDALGRSFADRGKRTADSIAAIRRLWSESPSAFRSGTVSFPALYCEPRPRRAIPIVIAGGSTAAARRAGALGDGFYPHPSVRDLAPLLAVMRSSALAAGRDPDQIELTVADAPTAGNARRARTLGAQRFLIDVYGTEPDAVGDFIEESLNRLG
jgi:probable F420-dependent oxidoreductase